MYDDATIRISLSEKFDKAFKVLSIKGILLEKSKIPELIDAVLPSPAELGCSPEERVEVVRELSGSHQETSTMRADHAVSCYSNVEVFEFILHSLGSRRIG